MPMIENFDVSSGELLDQFEVTEEEYRLYQEINAIPGAIDDVEEWLNSIRQRNTYKAYDRAMKVL